MDKSTKNYSKNFTKQVKGIIVLERDTKHKSRGVMLRAPPDLSLWNSSIRFYSCFEDDVGLFTCELLFNASDPTHIVTHDQGVVQANIKFYFPWFSERKLGPNYLTNINRTLAQERGIDFIIIDATDNKGSYSVEVIFFQY